MLVRYDCNEACKGKDKCNCECVGLMYLLKSLNVASANGIFIVLIQRKGLKNTQLLGLNLTKQNDLHQEMQFLISVFIIPFYFLTTVSNSGNIWILLKVLLYLMVMQILFLVKFLKTHSSQEMKIFLYLIRNHSDQTERYFLWFIVLKMDVVNHLNLLHCCRQS